MHLQRTKRAQCGFSVQKTNEETWLLAHKKTSNIVVLLNRNSLWSRRTHTLTRRYKNVFPATINPYSLEEVRDSYLTAGKWGLWVHCLVCPTKWTHVLECSSVLMWPLFFSFFQIPVCRSIRRNIWGAYVSSHILQQTWPTTDPGYNWPVPTRGDNVLPFH